LAPLPLPHPRRIALKGHHQLLIKAAKIPVLYQSSGPRAKALPNTTDAGNVLYCTEEREPSSPKKQSPLLLALCCTAQKTLLLSRRSSTYTTGCWTEPPRIRAKDV
jgi:hypothetical protein